MLKVSIITVVKNHAVGLEKTFKSLEAQTYSDWEMLIVVGNSEDATLDRAREFAAKDSRVFVLEETESGIYPAMNQGLAKSQGKYSWFMNAGDVFATPFVLERALDAIENKQVGVVIGGYMVEGRESSPRFFRSKSISAFKFAFNRRGGCHQAMIFDSGLLKAGHGYRTKYVLASDFDLVLRIIKKSGAHRIPDILAIIEPGGFADVNLRRVFSEKDTIRREAFPRNVLVSILSKAWTQAAEMKSKRRNVG